MSIKGIGTDIMEISRISDILSRSHRFLERVFTKKELEYFAKKNNKHETIAAAWCAKEAVSKALGTGVRGFELKDIEIAHDTLGKPFVNLYNGALLIFESKEGENIQISLSHSDSYAVAFCIIE